MTAYTDSEKYKQDLRNAVSRQKGSLTLCLMNPVSIGIF